MSTPGFISGFTSCFVMVILGIVLLITGKKDLAATILGIDSIILGAVWGFVFLGMLLGW